MTTPDTYKRGQVEWALWRYFASRRPEVVSPPKVFTTRIKRLLELDGEKDVRSETEHDHYAFFEDRAGGQGVDTRFTAFNAFCLAIGLDLLDAGFKQSEVVFVLKHIRRRLESQHAWITKNPVQPRARIPAEDRPGCPSFKLGKFRYADCRVFAVIEKVELTEAFAKRTAGPSLILEPTFCRGLDALSEELRKMNMDFRKALVIELAHTAVMVAGYLEEAPLVRRGRK